MRLIRVFCGIVLVAGFAGAANILLNSSFETWLLGMPVGWLTSEPTSPGSAAQDTSAHSGTYCVLLTGLDTAAYMTSGTVVQAGRSYYFSGFARVGGALGGSFVLQFASVNGLVGSPEALPVY
jgi:hypothetical protein